MQDDYKEGTPDADSAPAQTTGSQRVYNLLDYMMSSIEAGTLSQAELDHRFGQLDDDEVRQVNEVVEKLKLINAELLQRKRLN